MNRESSAFYAVYRRAGSGPFPATKNAERFLRPDLLLLWDYNSVNFPIEQLRAAAEVLRGRLDAAEFGKRTPWTYEERRMVVSAAEATRDAELINQAQKASEALADFSIWINPQPAPPEAQKDFREGKEVARRIMLELREMIERRLT